MFQIIFKISKRPASGIYFIADSVAVFQYFFQCVWADMDLMVQYQIFTIRESLHIVRYTSAGQIGFRIQKLK